MAASNLNMQKASGGILNIQPVDGVANTSVTIPESGNLVSVGTTVTDNAIARYDGATGKLQNSGVTIDDRGNVGVGMTPSAWRTQQKVIEIDGSVALSNFNGLENVSLSTNMYINSSNQSLYKNNGYASYYSQSNSIHEWYIAPSGTAGNVIPFTNALNLDASGNLLLISGTGALGYGAGAGGTVTQLTSKSTSVTLNKPCGKIITSNSSLGAGGIATFLFYNNLYNSINDMLYIQPINSINANAYNIWATNNGPGFGFAIYIKNTSNISLADTLEINFALIKGAIA